ncbi:MAG: glycine--tRNA ligase [Candidatus Ureaplasma intestinipullorum]|uniref:Glycine--tRNA ligase n=1 Tax=Candidatus Ureaplasma intestinipullorum TaxID=2838770 RepID=A0A9E2KVZ5_9BACT|nr:glycine--tRNA ligase [Candidatus Ureaplasma intestinipullorum]
MNKKITQDTIVNHLKTWGFVFQNSEIYNGLANAWDYGPLGVNLKNNIKKLWWDHFVQDTENVYGFDSGILMNQNVWKASGHLANFSDPLIDCKNCQSRFRADKLIESANINEDIVISESTPNDVVQNILNKHNIKCPVCNEQKWTDIRKFNLMFKTYQGVIEDESSVIYLRPETAQGIFVNFKNVQRTMRAKLPFGIGQIGKSFRNEITPGNFIFRTREFEQMELEMFCHENDAMQIFEQYLEKVEIFLIEKCGINYNNFKLKEHDKEELSHYSKRTVDIIYDFPHGYSELWGIAHRGKYDLTVHMEHSKKDLTYLDEKNNEKIIPEIIEPSVGVERLLYAICCDSYHEEIVNDETRVVLKFPYDIAPYKLCILPLTNKQKEFAKLIYKEILKHNISATYDSSGSIGKRYRRQDAIGTPFCITVDFDSDKNRTVSVRYRDSMKQEVIKIEEIINYIKNHKDVE